MTVQVRTDVSTIPFIRHSGPGALIQDGVIKQDAGRAAVLATFTALAYELSTGKYVPLTDVNPTLTSASLACGVNGGLIAAYQNADSEFAITIDGTLTNIQVDMTAIVALTDISDAINTISIPLGVICSYNEETNTFYFSSLKKGLPASTITVLTAVVAGAGTDISGATHLNGLTAVGTVTAATGGDGEDAPAAIYLGPTITAADIVAGDVEDLQLLTGDAFIDEDQLVIENSLTLASVVTRLSQTVRDVFRSVGIQPTDTIAFSAQENT